LLSVNDIYQLRKILDSKGCFQRVQFRVSLKLIAMLLIFLIGYPVALKISLPLGLLLLIPLSLPLAIIMMIGHEAGHQSIFHSRIMNKIVYSFILSFVGGLSTTYWTVKHNNNHHSAPNVVGRDNDIELWPIAFYQEKIIASGKGRGLKFFQTHLQRFLFWGLCFFTAFSMKLDGIVYLFKQKHALNKSMIIDITLLIMHYLLWLILPIFFVSFAKAFTFFLLQWALTGWILAIIFIVGHTGQPILKYLDKPPIGLALMTSQDIKLPRYLSWVFVGLDYQIEHHLFPMLNHLHMKKASQYVKQWILAKQLPYHETTLFQALKIVYIMLKLPPTSQSFAGF
jgi:fatty acid desaturase